MNVVEWIATRPTDGIYPNNAAVLYDGLVNLRLDLYLNLRPCRFRSLYDVIRRRLEPGGNRNLKLRYLLFLIRWLCVCWQLPRLQIRCDNLSWGKKCAIDYYNTLDIVRSPPWTYFVCQEKLDPLAMGLTGPQSRLCAHRPGHHDHLLATCRTGTLEAVESAEAEYRQISSSDSYINRVPALLSDHQPFTQQVLLTTDKDNGHRCPHHARQVTR